uniref:Cytochrome P450 monooxygenase n=1 Tax=Trametes versicolor TaxID=5325 RepID=A0AA86MBS6_TRAVE|nr:cytochrome P450 monooxygenase [Trametes versicolor]
MFTHLPVPWLSAAAVAVLVLLVLRLFRREQRVLPPGPKGLPVLGNAHQLPVSFSELERTLFKWSKQYGEVVYYKVLGTRIIMLNTIEAAAELLDKRSANYSDRPRMVMQNEMIEASTLGSLPYGDLYRKHRRWMADFMGKKSTLEGYRHIQRREVLNFMQNLYQQPEKFTDHVHLYLASILLEIAYGMPVKSLDDELVRLADRAIIGANEAGRPGAVPVDFLPWLRHIPSWTPGVRFKKHALIVRNDIRKWLNKGYDAVVSAMAAGTVAPCIMTTVLEEHGEAPTPAEAHDIKYVAFNVYGAGVETSRGTLAVFFLAMVRNTDVYKKAQEEIDRVVGRERLPDYSDRESLPYLDALLEEVFRWKPALPLGVPHRNTEDDHYREYDIPGGCMVIPNVWAMSRDTRYYPEPEEFRPERHLGGEASGKLLPSSFIFGFGRRVCPGQAFASASVWLAIAHIIALFDVRKPVDSAGREVTPPAEFVSGYTSRPAPFMCNIVPRSKEAVALLQAHISV